MEGNSILFEKKRYSHNIRPTTDKIIKVTNQEALIVLGFLGSGKTSLIENIIPYLKQKGKKIKLIVNDIGNINIDANRLKKTGLDIVALTDGCICCSDISSLKNELEKIKGTGEMIIIEPTGLATAEDIKTLTISLGLQTKVITLINTNDYLNNNQPDQAKESTIWRQISIADKIGLTRTTDKVRVEEIRKDLSSLLNTKIGIIEVPYQSKSIENFGNKEFEDEIHLFWQKIQEKNPNKPLFLPLKKKINYNGYHLHGNVFSFGSKDIPEKFGKNELESLVKNFEKNLYRVKGVIDGREFDYVQSNNELNRGKFINIENYMNIIGSKSLDINLENMCIECEKNSKRNHISHSPKNRNISLEDSKKRISILINQYNQYMDMDSEKKELLIKNESSFDEERTKEIINLELKMQELGDSMKYDNPLIWIEYKRLAYANEGSKKVTTVAELRKHCERPTYICYKRLDFLNKHLKKKYNIDFFDDENIDSETSLEYINRDKNEIQEICADESFMRERLNYEYFFDQGKTAKRENYNK